MTARDTADARFELAHMAHAELYTPDLEGSLWFFTQLLGMRETARHQGSVYLRCYEDPYHHSLKLTERDQPGLGNFGWRTTSAEALERRATALDAAGLGLGWTTGDLGVGRTFAFQCPDGHPMELVWDVERYTAPAELRSRILTRRSKRPLQGLPPRRLDHINLMASDVTVQKELFEQTLGFGTRERVVDGAGGGAEIGAWMSVNVLGHEMAIMRDQTGSKGRLHHLAFWYGVPQHNTDAAELCREYGIQIEAGPRRATASPKAPSSTSSNPAATASSCSATPASSSSNPTTKPSPGISSDFDTGLAIGGATLPAETYFVYGTPGADGQDKLLASWTDRALV